MPEKQEMEYTKLDGKGWLYKNENKASDGHPDFKGKLAGVNVSTLSEYADADGNVDILLSGWSEVDKDESPRVGIKPSLARPKESAAATANDPFAV